MNESLNICAKSVICKGQDGMDRMGIPITAKQNLKLSIFKMKHWTQATYYLGEIGWITKKSVLQYQEQKEIEHAYKCWTYKDMPMFDKVDLKMTFELVGECLSRQHGVNGCPASYIICLRVQLR